LLIVEEFFLLHELDALLFVEFKEMRTDANNHSMEDHPKQPTNAIENLSIDKSLQQMALRKTHDSIF
jgi:hypothetical protein